MAIFFNIDLIKKEANGDSKRFLKLFEKITFGNLSAPNHELKSVKINDLRKGTNFILNARALLSDNTVDIDYIIQYIILASLRDYYLYKQYRVKYLDISYFPDLDREVISHNPLIHIKDNKIYFKYEELYGT